MSTVIIPPDQWATFLEEFSRHHVGWLVRIETHDLQTAEDVSSRFLPLKSVELDVEEEKNPRVNVTVQSENKEIKQILFRPSRLAVYLSNDGTEEAVRI